LANESLKSEVVREPWRSAAQRKYPRTGQTTQRRIFRGEELQATVAAANEPFKLLFLIAAVSGARLSELLGLRWQDLDLSDPTEAAARFEHQVDRSGKLSPLKTEESRRTVELPRQLARLLLDHKAASSFSTSTSFVFTTRSGRPLGQRNVLRELRRAMKAAVTSKGSRAFPALHEDGEISRGSVSNFHSIRHTAASQAIAAGDGTEEVSWMLGHKNSTITRSVYVQEVKIAERRAMLRARMEARHEGLLNGSGVEATDRNRTQETKVGEAAQVLPLRQTEV
jgi:integrase